MKLIKYKQPIMVEKNSNNSTKYNFVETVDTLTEDDITSFETLQVFGILTNKDYMFVRSEIAALMISSGGFSSLTNEQKLICIKFSVVTKIEALTIVSAEDRSIYNKEVVGKLKDSRAYRIESARRVIGDKILDGDISLIDGNDLLNSTETLFNRYITGANPEFIDWLNSAGDHTADGFSFKSYYDVDIKDTLINIVLNGII